MLNAHEDGTLVINEREMRFKASIDSLPYYQWKTPTEVIQLLKRIVTLCLKTMRIVSNIVIITTLAAKSIKVKVILLQVEYGALRDGYHISAQAPMIPNPVNPAEDFADKRYDEKSAQYRLQKKLINGCIKLS